MEFAKWLLQESSLTDLRLSAIAAFPNTTKRQHATDPIKIIEVNWTPFLGTKSLLVRSIAQSDNKEYNPLVMFTGVKYREQSGSGVVEITDNDNRSHFLNQPSFSKTEVKLRCNCGDFFYRFNFFDHLDRSLYGRKRAPYIATTDRGPINPTESSGICKHLMKLMQVLGQSGLIGE